MEEKRMSKTLVNIIKGIIISFIITIILFYILGIILSYTKRQQRNDERWSYRTHIFWHTIFNI